MKEGSSIGTPSSTSALSSSSSSNGTTTTLSAGVMGATTNSAASLNDPFSFSSGLLPSNNTTNAVCLNSSPLVTGGIFPGTLPSSGGGFNNRTSQPSSPTKVPYNSNSSNEWNHDSSTPEKASTAEPLSLVAPSNGICDLLADPLGQTVSGKRSQDGQPRLKLKISQAKINGKNSTVPPDVLSPPPAKTGKVGRPAKQNGFHKAMEKTSPSVEDVPVVTPVKKGRRRTVNRKEKGPPRGRGKNSSVVPNGEDQSPTREPPVKKTKTESAASCQKRGAAAARPTTASVSTATDPEHYDVGPAEPGATITLQGQVWCESPDDFLVLHVTWRGKSYIGSLLENTKHNWAPARLQCDTPPSDSELNRTSAKERGVSKRLRNGDSIGESPRSSGTAAQARRGGLTRRGANFQASSPAGSEAGTPAKRGKSGRPCKLGTGGPSLRGSETKDSLSDLPSPTDELKPKRGRRATSGSSTPGIDSQLPPASPIWIECPDPQCGKKYPNQEGLLFHQQKSKHAGQPSVAGSNSSYDEERSSDSLSDPNGGADPTIDVKLCSPKTVEPAPPAPVPAEAPAVVPPPLALVTANSPVVPIPALPLQTHLDLVLSGAVSLDSTDEESRQKNKQRRKQSNPVSSQQKRNPDGGNGEVEKTDLVPVETSVPTSIDNAVIPKPTSCKASVAVEPGKEPKSPRLPGLSVEPGKAVSPPQSNGFPPNTPLIQDLSRGASFPNSKETPGFTHRPEALRIPMTGPCDASLQTAVNLSSQLPLDLKINSSQLHPAKINSPLAMSSVGSPLDPHRSSSTALSDVKTTYDLEDISDDEPDDTKKGPEKSPSVPSSRPSGPGSGADKSPPLFTGFPYGGYPQPPPYMVAQFGGIEPDRKLGGSPADLSKPTIGSLNAFANIFPSHTPSFSGLSHSPQPVDAKRDVPARSSPVTVPKPRRDSEKSESTKPSVKESKNEPVKSDFNGKSSRDEAKGPLEDVTGTHNKMTPPASGGGYSLPPHQFPGPGYRQPPGFPANYPGMSYGPQRMYPGMLGDQQLYMQLAASMYNPYNAPGRAGPPPAMPPGLPQMAGGATAVGGLDLVPGLQQRHGPPQSASNPHKIHELNLDGKSENKKPSSSSGRNSSSRPDSSSPKNLSMNIPRDTPDDRLSGEYFGGMTPIRRGNHP